MFSFFNRLFTKQDELAGLWENDLDDGSGLHAIWGWSFRFNSNGTGTYFHWSEGEIDSEIPFYWQRITEKSIRCRYEGNNEWNTIEYSIVSVDAPYSGKLLKLTDKNHEPNQLSNEGFWDCFGAVFKSV